MLKKNISFSKPSLALANQALFSPGLLPLPVHTFRDSTSGKTLFERPLGPGSKLFDIPSLGWIVLPTIQIQLHLRSLPLGKKSLAKKRPERERITKSQRQNEKGRQLAQIERTKV